MRRINQALWRMSAVMGAIIVSAPTVVSVSTATASEGYSLVHTVTLSGAVSGAAATYAFSLVDGTATSGVDYGAPTFNASVTLGGGNVTVPIGVSVFTVTIPALTDASYAEATESYTLSVGGISAGGSIYNVLAPAAVTYGAPTDSGETNTGDAHAGNLYYFNQTTGATGNTGLVEGSPTKGLAKLFDYTTYLSSGNTLTAPNDSIFAFARDTTQAGFVIFSDVVSGYGNFEIGAYGAGARPIIQFEHNSTQSSTSLAGIQLKYAGGRVKNLTLDMQHAMAFQGAPSTAFTVGEDVTVGGVVRGVYQYYSGNSYHVVRLTGAFVAIANGNVVTGASSACTATAANVAYIGGISSIQTGTSVINTDVIAAAGDGIQIGGGLGTTGNNSTITGSTVDGACQLQDAGAGIAGGHGDGVSITYTTIKDCGCSDRSHNIYLNTVKNFRVANCWSYMTAAHGNHGLVLHDVCEDGVIEDNLFEGCGNGIGINDGHSTIESFTRITVRRNINRNLGWFVGQGQGQPFDLSCMIDSEFYNNLSYNCNLPYNITAWRGTAGGDSITTNTRFCHETLHNVSAGMRITGTFGAIPPVVQNCIISSSRTTNNEVVLWVDQNAVSSGVIFRKNIIYAPNATGNVVWWGSQYYASLAAWKAMMDTNYPGHGNIINTDPLFVNAATYDLRLQAGSPAKLAGYNSGITTDFDGNARNATTPSIGAYE